MATQIPSNRPRTSAPPRRPQGTQPAARPRPSGARSNSPRRPASTPARRAPSRRRKPKGRFYAFLAALLLIVLIVLAVTVFRKPSDVPVNAIQTPVPVVTADPGAQTAPDSPDATEATTASRAEQLAQMLGSEGTSLQGLSADEMAQVSDLSVNRGLPSEWMNVLLLGSDERTLEESARTDSMIICSININTGEVKLTSIMRDLAVNFDDIGQYNGTYRINSANFFGGEELAMRTVNECFDMNIEKYVHVNFYGFQQVAEMLGGVDMDITEAEMNEINYRIKEQWWLGTQAGIDESNLPNQLLETYGSVHLDGRQTLAYARIRKIDSDFARTERQRKVLVKLLEKLKSAGAAQLLQLAQTGMQYVRTNMTLDEIAAVAVKVMGNGLEDVESLHLPVNGTYVQETRNEQAMFYDCDWNANASELYNFIYG